MHIFNVYKQTYQKTYIHINIFKCNTSIFCLIHIEVCQYFFLMFFYASRFLYAFPFSTFFRMNGLGCMHCSRNIKCTQSTSTHIGPIVMIYHFKNPHVKKERNSPWLLWNIRSEEPCAICLLLMWGLTRPQSFSLIGRSFVLKTRKLHTCRFLHAHIHIA